MVCPPTQPVIAEAEADDLCYKPVLLYIDFMMA